MISEDLWEGFKDGEAARGDPVRSWVRPVVVLEHAAEKSNILPSRREAGIWFTHEGELRSNSTKGFLHSFTCDAFTLFVLGEFATAVADGEDNKEVEWVAFVGSEVGVDAD